MYWNRFDICEAWYLALSHYHGGQCSPEYLRLCKLLGYFKPAPTLSIESLKRDENENALAIYYNACNTMGGTGND